MNLTAIILIGIILLLPVLSAMIEDLTKGERK
jgi:hypothetical protein